MAMSPDDIDGLDDVTQFTDFSADIDLTNQSGFPRRPARYIRVETSGASTKLLVVRTANSGTTDRTLTTKDDFTLIAKITRIRSTTTVTRVTVGW